jgi:hypothetical protein
VKSCGGVTTAEDFKEIKARVNIECNEEPEVNAQVFTQTVTIEIHCLCFFFFPSLQPDMYCFKALGGTHAEAHNALLKHGSAVGDVTRELLTQRVSLESPWSQTPIEVCDRAVA